MTIGNIGARDILELSLEIGRVINRAFPEDMSNAIIAGHVTVRLIVIDNSVDASFDNFLIVSKSKEHWLSVRVVCIYKACSVLLFFGKGQFVFFN